MEFIKNHKKLCIFIIVALIFLFLLILLFRVLSVDYSKSEYGDRLDGIENVKISKSDSEKLTSEMEELEEVKSCEYRIQGRLIYINITFKEGVAIDTAKELSNKVLEYFDDDEKAYYDIQIIAKNESKDAEGYPKIGYKHKTSDGLVW